jgi:hypothetical protein
MTRIARCCITFSGVNIRNATYSIVRLGAGLWCSCPHHPISIPWSTNRIYATASFQFEHRFEMLA